MSTGRSRVNKRRPGRKAGVSHQAAVLGIVCWITYFSLYLGRLNFSASMSDMIHSGIWGKGELGSVAAVFYLAYGLGQLPSGFLGDRLPPGRLVLFGLFGTALANCLFPAMHSVAGMQAVWFANGLLQALIWPPMVRLVTDRTEGKAAVNIILLLSFSSPAGMLCAYLCSALILRTASWEYCFQGAGLWLMAIALLWMVSIERMERTDGGKAVRKMPEEAKENAATAQDRQRKAPFSLKGFFCAGLFWLTGAAFIHGVLKDGLTTWIPTYLTERFEILPFLSVLLTTVLPVVNLSGVYIAEFGNRRIFRNEAAAGAAFYLVSMGSIVGMMLPGGNSLYGTVALFAIVTSMMTAVNTLLISLLPLHFQKEGRVATISGGLNAVTYVGSAAASALFGFTTEHAGWDGTRLIWCLCGAAGMIFCLMAVKRWGRQRKNIYE